MSRGPVTKTLSERVERWLDAKVQDDGYCWTWTGAVHTDGRYGIVGWRGKQVPAHRLVYICFNGEPADGQVVTHNCGNSLCINPGHLVAATRAEVPRRMPERQPECPHGHAWTPENTHITKIGSRICRECARQRDRARYARLREKATQ